MPRVGQLLSALLVALIGVLVVQMFLLAGMHQQLADTPLAPPVDQELPSLTAPQLESPLAAAPAPSESTVLEEPRTPSIVIVVAVPGLPPMPGDQNQAVIERFIDMTDTPIRSDASERRS